MSSNAARKLTPAEVKFRVEPREKAEAERIAAEIGMDVNSAMKVMLKRFIAERGFPFPMNAPAPPDTERRALGATTGQLAEIARAAFGGAAQAHLQAGRSITYGRADGTVVREHPDGSITSLSGDR